MTAGINKGLKPSSGAFWCSAAKKPLWRICHPQVRATRAGPSLSASSQADARAREPGRRQTSSPAARPRIGACCSAEPLSSAPVICSHGGARRVPRPALGADGNTIRASGPCRCAAVRLSSNGGPVTVQVRLSSTRHSNPEPPPASQDVPAQDQGVHAKRQAAMQVPPPSRLCAKHTQLKSRHCLLSWRGMHNAGCHTQGAATCKNRRWHND